MSDSLSQEDIDKLLKGNASEESPPESTPPEPDKNPGSFANTGKHLEYLSENEADALGEICNISVGAAATTLSMLLSNKVDISTPVVYEYSEIHELFNFDKDFITVQIKYKQGLDGISVFALDSRDSAIIADLMMGGSGHVDNPEIGELQLSAVGEAMNQMIGSSSTSLSSIFNFPIDITPPEVQLQKSDEKLKLSEEIFGVPIIAVKFNFIVGDLIDSEMIQLMSLSSAQYQVSTLIASMTMAVDEATTSGENTTPPPTDSQPPPPPPQNVPPSPAQSTPAQPVTVQPVQFASFDEAPSISGEANKNLDLLMDIKLKLSVELGKTELPIGKVLELTRGSVVELDKIAGEPVELFANGKLIAKGEVVVIEDNFGLRITSITSPDNRLNNLH